MFDNNREEELKQAILERNEELATVLKNKTGRRFMHRLINLTCAIDASSFSNDAMLMAYSQGRKDIGIEIKQAILSFDKQLFLKMESENV